MREKRKKQRNNADLNGVTLWNGYTAQDVKNILLAELITSKVLTFRMDTRLQESSGEAYSVARMGTGGVMVVQRSVTHLLIYKLHLEACYMMSPALWIHLPEFPYQLSTKKLNLLCDFGFSW